MSAGNPHHVCVSICLYAWLKIYPGQINSHWTYWLRVASMRADVVVWTTWAVVGDAWACSYLKTESGEWRPAGDPQSLGRLGSNAMAAVRDGGGGVLHINPHLVWNLRDLPFQEFDGTAMTFYETHIEVEGGCVGRLSRNWTCARQCLTEVSFPGKHSLRCATEAVAAQRGILWCVAGGHASAGHGIWQNGRLGAHGELSD